MAEELFAAAGSGAWVALALLVLVSGCIILVLLEPALERRRRARAIREMWREHADRVAEAEDEAYEMNERRDWMRDGR